jgi:hypothetical protein
MYEVTANVSTGRSSRKHYSKNALMHGTIAQVPVREQVVGQRSSGIGPNTHNNSSSPSASGAGSGARQAPDLTARKALGILPLPPIATHER